VPFPPGGSTDPVARIIQAKLMELTGWNVLIDNKPGGTGAVGSGIAAKAPPDGQTWMITFDSHILNPAFAPALPYRDSDLLNVMLIGRAPQVLAAHPDRPYKTFAEVVADGRKRPGKISVGVLGASQALVLLTLIKKENDVDLNLIPYKRFDSQRFSRSWRRAACRGATLVAAPRRELQRCELRQHLIGRLGRHLALRCEHSVDLRA
jgi:tripartite-type tricarboxylate transporter receptor subunit TctC